MSVEHTEGVCHAPPQQQFWEKGGCPAEQISFVVAELGSAIISLVFL